MAWLTDPSRPDLGQAQEAALMSIDAMQLTGRPGTHLAGEAPRLVTSKGGEQGARPSPRAADRGRWAGQMAPGESLSVRRYNMTRDSFLRGPWHGRRVRWRRDESSSSHVPVEVVARRAEEAHAD